MINLSSFNKQNSGRMGKLSKEIEKKKSKGALILVGLVVLLLVAAAGFGWLYRLNIAERYVASWCSERDLRCEARFAELGLRQVVLEDLLVYSDGELPVAVERVELALDWPTFLVPTLSKANVLRPTVRAAIIEGEPSLYGLEALLRDSMSNSSPSSDADAAIPELDVREGLLVIDTDAGEVRGAFALEGLPLQQGSATLDIQPSVLRRDDAELRWSKGKIDLIFRDGTLLGDIDFAVDRAHLNQLEIGPTELTGKFGEQDHHTAFDLSGTADSFIAKEVEWEALNFQLQGSVGHLDELSIDTIRDALLALTISADVKAVALDPSDTTIGSATISLDIRKDAGTILGPVALEAKAIANADASIDRLVLAGDIAVTAPDSNTYNYQGTASLYGASLRRGSTLENIQADGALKAHADEFRVSLSRALSKFDAGIEVSARYAEQAWNIEARRPTAINTASGLRLSISPFDHQPWMRIRGDVLEGSGNFSLSGGQGVPAISGAIQELRAEGEDIRVQARSLMLAPWQAGGQTISGRLDSLDLVVGSSLAIDADGEIAIAGELAGVDLQDTKLVGHVRAAQAGEGWRVQTHNNSCIGFSTNGIASGSLVFGSSAISLCPVDGRFVRQEEGQSVGSIELGDISIPFHTDDSRGVFGIQKAGVEWTAADGIDLVFKGESLSLPLEFDKETLTIDGISPEVVFAAHGDPVGLRASLGRTRFGGTMVPANVVADAFTFAGETSDVGVDGNMRARHVRIADLNASPVYEPLVADLSATMEEGIVHMSGPIRLESKNVVIANAIMNLHLARFSGDAQIVMEPLSFASGSLQPTDLSELLRGVLTNARGGMTGRADLLISDGLLSGDGYVDFIEIIFDTFTVGRVSGVNGRINFSDILALTTPPGQEMTIDFMDPGIPLRDGVLTFQIIEAETTRLEGARWPFAGGALLIAPAEFQAGGALDEIDTVTVTAQTLELERLIEVLQVPDLHATGTVSGVFPIDIEGANIMIRGAVLEADERGGKLSYTGSATDVVRGQNEYADHALEALKDLDYSVMRVGANGNLIGHIIVTADLLGKSENVLGGAEFDFGLSVDSNLSQLLRSASNATTQTYLAEAKALQEQEEADIDE